MKKKILLPIIFLALGALVGCGGNPDGSTPDSTPESTESVESTGHTYTWSISNKSELEAEWHVGDADRQITIESDPAVNLTTLLANEDAWITTTDATVVAVQGSYLKPISAGTATVTLHFACK